MKHIYWFCYFDQSEPSVRYRATYLLEHLNKEHDVKFDICYPGYTIHQILQFIYMYISVLLFRKKDSIIVFQKIRTNRVYANLLKLLLYTRNKDTIYDFDDADYLSFNKNTIDHFIKNCTLCSVGSSALAEYAMELNNNTIINTSPTISHSLIKNKKNDILTIGWIGYYDSHKTNLETLLYPTLKELNFPIKLILLGVTNDKDTRYINSYFKDQKNISILMPQNLDWENETSIYKQIAQFDIGVSPLLNTERNKAKSAFKLKQYFSCGVPVIASPTGENKKFVVDGENGFICQTPNHFKEHIISLNKMGNKQYDTLCKHAYETSKIFNMEQYSTTFMSLYQNEHSLLPQHKN